jgi:hypothetical protein
MQCMHSNFKPVGAVQVELRRSAGFEGETTHEELESLKQYTHQLLLGRTPSHSSSASQVWAGYVGL